MSDGVATLVAGQRRLPRLALSTSNLVIGGVLLGLLPLLVRRTSDPDFWWHLRTGRWIVEHRALPAQDLFTYTVSGHTWTDHEYLSQVLIYALDTWGGTAAVSVGFGAVILAGFLLVWRRIALRPVPFVVVAAALGVGILAGEGVWLPRPQAFEFTFVCLELYWVETFLAGRSRALYAFPAVVVAWANLHGSVVFALALLALAFAVEGCRWLLTRDPAAGGHVRGLGIVGAVSALAGLVNPHGISLYLYAWETETSGVQQAFIREWHSPDFHALDTRGFEALIVLLVVGVALRRARPWDIVVSVATLLLALQSVRHIALFVAAATPVVAWTWGAWVHDLPAAGGGGRLARLRLRPGDANALARLFVVVALAAGGGATWLALRHQDASTQANYPVGAADWLAAHPQVGTRMFSDYGWGGYLAYRFYPQESRRVFIFGEADLMGDTIMNAYADVVSLSSDWRSVLDGYGVNYVVFEPDTPLTSALAVLPGWRLEYADSVADIYVRTGS